VEYGPGKLPNRRTSSPFWIPITQTGKSKQVLQSKEGGEKEERIFFGSTSRRPYPNLCEKGSIRKGDKKTNKTDIKKSNWSGERKIRVDQNLWSQARNGRCEGGEQKKRFKTLRKTLLTGGGPWEVYFYKDTM